MSDIVPDSSGGGNTINPSSSKQISPAKQWCFTLNNWTDDDVNNLVPKFQEVAEKYIFENECGEQGTPHLQGYVCFKKKLRPLSLGLNQKIHWEKIKGKEEHNIEYCSKDYREKKEGVKLWSHNIHIKKPLKLIEPSKWWQIEILSILQTEPDDRAVYWYWSEAGGIGKSQFAKYCVARENCLFFEEGKKADIMHLIFEAPDERLEKIIIDVPRDNGNNISYKSIEAIKNGLIYSPKYEGGYKLFNSPHIIVFANQPPQEERLSADRWHIKNIDE